MGERDQGDNPMFPMVNAPSLELSRANTPRMSARLPENKRDQQGGLSMKAISQYERNLPKMAMSMNGKDQHQLSKHGQQILRKIFESYSSSIIDQLQQDNRSLQEALEQKNEELICIAHKTEELEDFVTLLKSQGPKEAELLQSRVLQKAKNERDKALAESCQKDKELNSLVEKCRQLEMDNDALREALNEEIEHLMTELEKVEAVSSCYKSQEAEIGRELEELKHELVKKDRKLESQFQIIQNQERDINEVKMYIRESEQRGKDLENALSMKDSELEDIISQNQQLKLHLDEFMSDPNHKFNEEDRNKSNMTEDERDQYEWQINELQRQLASHSVHQMNGKNSRKSPISTEKFTLPDPFTGASSELSKQTSTSDKSEQCKLLENYFRGIIEAILKENRCLEDTQDLSLGQLHSVLIKFVRDMSQRCMELERENQELQLEVELCKERLQEDLNRESLNIENQAKLIRDENESLRRLVQTQKEEIINLSATVSQRSSAKLGPPRQTVAKSQNTRESKHSELDLKNFGTQTESVRTQEVGYQMVDQAGLEKVRHLEKGLKDAKHDTTVKVKLIKELEAKCEQLEQTIDTLKSKEESDNQGKKRLEQLEKKVNVMSIDLSAKDKKNIELYDIIKKLRAENDTLNQSLKLNSEKSILSKNSAKRTQSTTRKLGSQKTVRESFADSELYVEQINTEVREAKAELSELYKKVDKFYTEKGVLYNSLDSQLKRNKTLVKENSFLRECLENIASVPRTIELEMLSSDETEDLLDQIIHMALQSQSMKRRLLDSDEFAQLCSSVLKQSTYKYRDSRFN